jgi:hypothetical protein
MRIHSSRANATTVVSALALLAAVSFGHAVARADAIQPTKPAERSPGPQVAEATKAAPAPRARPRANDVASLYACHPHDDLSCTVIHETAQGIVVVTFRPTGAKETRVWSVVNAPAEPGSASAGGTIYVVPGASRPVSDVQPPTQFSDNSAPILD